MTKPIESYAVVRRNGKEYVLVEVEEFKSLAGGPLLAPLPEPGTDGTVPAAAYARASIARNIAARRAAAGVTQSQLAELAGVRTETVNRLENARHTADVATLTKIDRALTRAGPGEKPQATRAAKSRGASAKTRGARTGGGHGKRSRPAQ